MEQKHFKLPYGTVITQAKDQPNTEEGLWVSVDLPWGTSIRANADLKDVFAASSSGTIDEEMSKKGRITS